MSVRPEKKAIVDGVRTALQEAPFTFLADYQGLNVEQLSDLRRQLSESDASMYVVKNRLLRQAAVDTDWPELKDLNGPTAMISGSGEITAVAKLLAQFKKENELPTLKGGWMQTASLSAGAIEELAKIPPREIMLGKLVGTIAAPMSQMVGVMRQKVLTLLYVLKAVEEKKGNA